MNNEYVFLFTHVSNKGYLSVTRHGQQDGTYVLCLNHETREKGPKIRNDLKGEGLWGGRNDFLVILGLL